MKKLLLILVVAGAFLAVAAYWLSPAPNGDVDGGYTIDKVEWGPLTETINATGSLQPLALVPVGSEIAGKVIKLYPGADTGRVVQQGDPLLDLDSEVARLTLEQAKHAHMRAKQLVSAGQLKVDAARTGLDLQQQLYGRQLADKKAVDQARLQVQAAETELQSNKVAIGEASTAVQKAELGLRLTQLKSPVSGTILERAVEEGSLIGPANQGHLFFIASNMERMRLHAQVAESDIGRVKLGQKAKLSVSAYGDTDYQPEGVVVEIKQKPTMVQSAVFYDVLIEVPNEPRNESVKDGRKIWKLMPGMTASVDIIQRTHPHVWKVKTAALNFQLDEHYQTDAARQKLKKWDERPDKNLWQPVWVMGKDHKPWPLFLRLGGTNSSGETAIGDAQFREILEWDPDLSPPPNEKDDKTYPRVITAAPPVKKTGLFDQFKLKV